MTSRTKRAAAALVSAVMALVFGVAAAAPAAAVWSDCPRGHACIWQNSDYSGGTEWEEANKGNFTSPLFGGLYNSASSAMAYGGLCMTTRFYEEDNQSTDNGATFFYLYSMIADGGNQYKDPYLANGAGYGPGRALNFNDDIESWWFTNC